MPLILTNTSSVEADLHRTDAKSSILLHLPPEWQWCDSWGCFDHCFPHSSLLIIFTMFAYGRLHLFSSSSAVCHCRKRTVPPAETISYDAPPMREPAPVLVPPATADRGATTISTISPRGSLRDTFLKISTALRNTGGLYESPQGRAERLGQLIFRCAAEIHNAWSSLSQFILLAAALFAGKQTSLIAFQMATLSFLLSKAMVCGGEGCVQRKPGQTPLIAQTVPPRR